jgi:hypothetical protein
MVFGPLLIAAGLLGFVLPARLNPMSGRPIRNVLRICLGIAGVMIAFPHGSEGWARAFNLLLGALGAAQLFLSRRGGVLKDEFGWTRTDDALNLLVGPGLIALALFF